MSPQPTHPEVLITPADAADLDALSQKLAAKGLTNANILSSAGIITGNAAAEAMEGLRAEPGVASVELSGGVQIPPPDSEVQ
jgi:hypothetical protein